MAIVLPDRSEGHRCLYCHKPQQISMEIHSFRLVQTFDSLRLSLSLSLFRTHKLMRNTKIDQTKMEIECTEIHLRLIIIHSVLYSHSTISGHQVRFHSRKSDTLDLGKQEQRRQNKSLEKKIEFNFLQDMNNEHCDSVQQPQYGFTDYAHAAR